MIIEGETFHWAYIHLTTSTVLFQHTPYTLPLLFSAAFTGIAAYFAWRRYPKSGSLSFVVVMGTNTVIAPAMLLFLSTRQYVLGVVCISVVLVGLFVTAVGWASFGYTYTGQAASVSPERRYAVAGSLVAAVALIVTNPWHELVYVTTRVAGGGLAYELGPALWVLEGAVALLVTAGSVQLLRQAVRSRNIYRRLNFLNALGGFSLLLLHELDVLGLTPTPYFVDGMLLFAFWGVVSVVSLLSVRFVQFLPLDAIVARLEPGSDTLVPLGRDYVLEDIDDGVVILDADGSAVDMNSTAKTLLGRESIGDDIRDLPEVGAALRTDGSVDTLADTHEECWVDTQSGDRYFKITVSTIESGTGSAAGYVCLLQDMTDLKRREETVGLLKDTMSRFLRHNIRNEMNVARSRVNMLGTSVHEEDDEFDETRRVALERIDKLVEQSEKARHVEDVVETGRTVTDIDVAPVIDGLLEQLRHRYPEVEFAIDIDRPLCVVSSKQIGTAIENLVVNAIEHNDAEQKLVRIASRDRGDRIEIVVVDNGPGIPDDEVIVLREREETDLRHGSGFGLWLVNWILDHSDGDVTFESDDSGTTVCLRLQRGTPGAATNGRDDVSSDRTDPDVESITRSQD